MTRRASRLALPSLLAIALLGGCATGSQGPGNIHFHKERLTQYRQSGDYERDIAKVADEANAWLAQRLKTPGKHAVVFDIDETALSNWPSIKANDFGWITGGDCKISDKGEISKPCGLGPWIQMGRAEAIKPVLGVYQTARKMGPTFSSSPAAPIRRRSARPPRRIWAMSRSLLNA
jgi:acid phosphatase